MRLLLSLSLLLFTPLALPVWAQITPTAVTDAASFANRVAPGSLATIFGTGIATASGSAAALPLPNQLAGVTVTVNNIPAPLLYVGVSPYNQINFQIPAGVQPGTASLVVWVNGQSSAPFSFEVTSAAPGIFAYAPTGVSGVDPTLLQVVAQNAPSYGINSPSNPAPTGSVVVVYLDGIGAVAHPVGDGYAATGANAAVSQSYVTVGGELATVQYMGLAPGFVGLGQANVQIPDDLPTGDYPMVIYIDGYQSTSAMISVSGNGTALTYVQEVSLFDGFEVSERNTIQILDKSLYLCGDVRVRVFDITNPASAAFTGHYGEDHLNNGRQISCSVNSTITLPYLASVVGPMNNPSLTVLDLVPNSQVPTLLASGVSTGGYNYLRRLLFDGNIGIANTNWIDNSNRGRGDILSFDFTDPSRPVFLSALQSTGTVDYSSQPKSFIRLAGPHVVYATSAAGGTGALDVINTSSPDNMQVVAQTPVPGTKNLEAFAISGKTLLALGNTGDPDSSFFPSIVYSGTLTMTTMDVTNLNNPVVIRTVDTGIPASGSLRVVPLNQGNGIFAVVYQPAPSDYYGPNTLAIVDASNPSQPYLSQLSTYYGYDGLGVSNGYLFAATGSGMSIYKILQ